MKILVRFFLFVTLGLRVGYSQSIEPLELAKKIFDKKGFSAINTYITGEYKGIPNGKDLKKDAETKYRLLTQTDQLAVVALTVVDPSGQGVDRYLYFTKAKDGIWKMYAIRALTMAGFGANQKRILEKLTQKQIDSTIAVAHANKNSSARFLFSSREEYEFLLGNSRLMTMLDGQLISYFNDNKKAFNQLKERMINAKKKIAIDPNKKRELEDELKANCRKLFIEYAPVNDYNFRYAMEFVIGGMGDNFVGYVYIPDPKNVPVMSEDLIIMLRELGDGWYLYKTT